MREGKIHRKKPLKRQDFRSRDRELERSEGAGSYPEKVGCRRGMEGEGKANSGNQRKKQRKRKEGNDNEGGCWGIWGIKEQPCGYRPAHISKLKKKKEIRGVVKEQERGGVEEGEES